MNSIRINRSQLELEYNWKNESNEKSGIALKVKPGTFVRTSGYDVLSFINCFMIKFALFYVEEGKKIEKLIQLAPASIENEDEMTLFILKNWQ
jgi:hypothetical protein